MNMVSLQSKLLGWLPDPEDGESGQGMVEYAFLLVLMALVIIVALILLGNQVSTFYQNLADKLAHPG
jgi:pilus assembly protein Flp/PilA